MQQETAANEDAVRATILEIAVLTTLYRKITWEKSNSTTFSNIHYLFSIPRNLSANDLITIMSRNQLDEELLKDIAALNWSTEWETALDRLNCKDISNIFSV